MNSPNNNGLSFCPKCLESALLGVPCECVEERRKQSDAEWHQDNICRDVEQKRKKGLAYPKYRQWRFDNDNLRNPDITNTCRRYVEEWAVMRSDSVGIVFMGDAGTGKSFNAGCIANSLIDRNIPVLMTGFRKIVDDLFDAGYGEKRRKFFKELQEYELLIIEDVGVERGTAYISEQFYYMIDEWYLSLKPLIITTNLDTDELLTEALDYKRSFDRIIENNIQISMTGESRRLDIAGRKHEKYMDLLGLQSLT